MLVVGIDPGKTFGWCFLHVESRTVVASGHGTWLECAVALTDCDGGGMGKLRVYLEWPDAYGSLPQADLYQTMFDAGQCIHALGFHGVGIEVHKVHRRDVKKYLLGRVSGTDANLRAALVAEFGDGSDQAARKCKSCQGVGQVPVFASATCSMCSGSGKDLTGKRPCKCKACKGRGSFRVRDSALCCNCNGTGKVGTDGALSMLSGSHEWAALAVAVTFAETEKKS